MCLCVVHWIEQKNYYGCPLNVCPIAYENWPKFTYCSCTCWIQGKVCVKMFDFESSGVTNFEVQTKKCKQKNHGIQRIRTVEFHKKN